MPTTVRTICGELQRAERVPPHAIPAAQSAQSKSGLRYQKRVTKALAAFATARNYELEAEPWFAFIDDNGPGLCVPDALLLRRDASGDHALIIEIKWTYTPVAFTKLALLYVPVLRKALAIPCAALIVAQHMTKDSPHGAYGMAEALRQPEPVMHWLGYGDIPA